MNTDDLILQLADAANPVERHLVRRRLVLGLGSGAAASTVLVLLWLGSRQDIGAAMGGPALWLKLGYTFSLAIAALAITAQLARPSTERIRGLWLLAAPVVFLGVAGLLELSRTPRSDWLAMWLGRSWDDCPILVLVLAIPIFIGLLWSFRRLAPTRLRAAGAAAGLSAGAAAASVYCLHCPEAAAIFVLTWYSLGILLAALFGYLLGPWLLRW